MCPSAGRKKRDMDPKRKAQLGLHIQAVQAIQVILWEQWDPIGVNDWQEARAEYDSYAAGIVDKLTQGGVDRDVANHLGTLETDSMGLRISSMERRLEVARAAREALEALGAL